MFTAYGYTRRRVGGALSKQNYYERLGVPVTATTAEIDKAYRKLAVRLHPDRRQPASLARAQEEFKLVNEAVAALRDPALRQKYDLGLPKKKASKEKKKKQSPPKPFKPFKPPKPSEAAKKKEKPKEKPKPAEKPPNAKTSYDQPRLILNPLYASMLPPGTKIYLRARDGKVMPGRLIAVYPYENKIDVQYAGGDRATLHFLPGDKIWLDVAGGRRYKVVVLTKLVDAARLAQDRTNEQAKRANAVLDEAARERARALKEEQARASADRRARAAREEQVRASADRKARASADRKARAAREEAQRLSLNRRALAVMEQARERAAIAAVQTQTQATSAARRASLERRAQTSQAAAAAAAAEAAEAAAREADLKARYGRQPATTRRPLKFERVAKRFGALPKRVLFKDGRDEKEVLLEAFVPPLSLRVNQDGAPAEYQYDPATKRWLSSRDNRKWGLWLLPA